MPQFDHRQVFEEDGCKRKCLSEQDSVRFDTWHVPMKGSVGFPLLSAASMRDLSSQKLLSGEESACKSSAVVVYFFGRCCGCL